MILQQWYEYSDKPQYRYHTPFGESRAIFLRYRKRMQQRARGTDPNDKILGGSLSHQVPDTFHIRSYRGSLLVLEHTLMRLSSFAWELY